MAHRQKSGGKTSSDGATEFTEGSLDEGSTYVRKTDAEIRKFAMDLYGGQIFVSWQLREYEKDMLTMVFMPLLFLDEIQQMSLVRDEIVHFYGYMKDAMPRSINGLPMFTSVHFINLEDSKRVVAELKKLESYMTGEEQLG